MTTASRSLTTAPWEARSLAACFAELHHYLGRDLAEVCIRSIGMRNGARKKADDSRIARVGDVNHVGSVECFPAVRLDWFSERGALPSSSPSNGRTPQSPAAPQTTGTAAPDSGE